MATADLSAPQPEERPSGGRIVPFGKYLLLQRVSIGGMAEIFKAVPEGAHRLDNILAIKRILPNIAEDSEFIGMFVDEARIAGQLTHPHIGRIYELGKVGDTHYIAMQFLWGRDLLKVINRFKRVGRHTPPPLVAYVGARACAGLHYAHTKRDASGQPLNIIHRDVSPQNISVGYSGQVKLIDFGVARAASQSQKTQAGVLKGKFGYMSPEMVKGLPIDARSDVFAMGICLWEALTGQRLFYGESDFATLELVREARATPPSSKVGGIPAELDEIVLQALSEEPNNRFQSAAELQAALDELLALRYPGFGKDDVAVIMRQAFAAEVQRERQRLAVFEGMMQRGELVRGAELPPLEPESVPPPRPDDNLAQSTEAPTDGKETIVHPVSEEDLARLSGSYEAVHEEPTTIFFNADELEEIDELSSEEREAALDAHNPLHTEGPPPFQKSLPGATALLLPGAPVSLEDRPEAQRWADFAAFETLSAETLAAPLPTEAASEAAGLATPRGDYPRAVHGPSQTLEFPLAAGDELDDEPPASRSASVWLVLLAVIMGMLTYFGLHSLRSRTGELAVHVNGPSKSLVRVDGVLRGHPPLELEDVAPGPHNIDVEAEGYQPLHREVSVERGRSTVVQLVLRPESARPEGAAMAALDDGPAPAPLAGGLGIESGSAAAPKPRGTPERREAQAPAPRSPEERAEPRPRQRASDHGQPSDDEPASAKRAREQQPSPEPSADELREAERGEREDTPVAAQRPSPHGKEEAPEEAEAAEDEPAKGDTADETLQDEVGAEPAADAPPEEPKPGEPIFGPQRSGSPEPATLLISTLPWSRVFVDGVDTGRDTPVQDLKVSPGSHRVGMRTPDGRMHTVEIDAKPGEQMRIIRRYPLDPNR